MVKNRMHYNYSILCKINMEQHLLSFFCIMKIRSPLKLKCVKCKGLVSSCLRLMYSKGKHSAQAPTVRRTVLTVTRVKYSTMTC